MNRFQGLSLAALVTATSSVMACSQSVAQPGKLEIVASSSQKLSSDVARVTVLVGGGNVAPIQQDLTNVNGRFVGVVDGLPVGSADYVRAYAFDSSGNLSYQGQASNLIVSSGSASLVDVVLQNVNQPTPYSNAAPVIDSVYAASSATPLGGSDQLEATAHDPDGETVTYQWSATDGSFSDATSPSPLFIAPSSAEEIVTITLTVSDSQGATNSMNFDVSVSANASAGVVAQFNEWPSVSAMSANPTQIDVNGTTALSVTAADSDGDALSYAWTADCTGTFDNASATTPNFTLTSMPNSGSCTFTATVSDGHGGQTTGTLQIATGPATKVAYAPVIDGEGQSDPSAPAGGSVVFTVSSHDPQNGGISFAWTSDQGTFSAENDGNTNSQITWTAPTPFTSNATITVTITDDAGAQTTQTYTVLFQ